MKKRLLVLVMMLAFSFIAMFSIAAACDENDDDHTHNTNYTIIDYIFAVDTGGFSTLYWQHSLCLFEGEIILVFDLCYRVYLDSHDGNGFVFLLNSASNGISLGALGITDGEYTIRVFSSKPFVVVGDYIKHSVGVFNFEFDKQDFEHDYDFVKTDVGITFISNQRSAYRIYIYRHIEDGDFEFIREWAIGIWTSNRKGISLADLDLESGDYTLKIMAMNNRWRIIDGKLIYGIQRGYFDFEVEAQQMTLTEFRDTFLASDNWVIVQTIEGIASMTAQRNGNLFTHTTNAEDMVQIGYWLRDTDQFFETTMQNGDKSQYAAWQEHIGSKVHGGRSFDENILFVFGTSFEIFITGEHPNCDNPIIYYSISGNVLTFSVEADGMIFTGTMAIGSSIVVLPPYVNASTTPTMPNIAANPPSDYADLVTALEELGWTVEADDEPGYAVHIVAYLICPNGTWIDTLFVLYLINEADAIVEYESAKQMFKDFEYDMAYQEGMYIYWQVVRNGTIVSFWYRVGGDIDLGGGDDIHPAVIEKANDIIDWWDAHDNVAYNSDKGCCHVIGIQIFDFTQSMIDDFFSWLENNSCNFFVDDGWRVFEFGGLVVSVFNCDGNDYLIIEVGYDIILTTKHLKQISNHGMCVI